MGRRNVQRAVMMATCDRCDKDGVIGVWDADGNGYCRDCYDEIMGAPA